LDNSNIGSGGSNPAQNTDEVGVSFVDTGLAKDRSPIQVISNVEQIKRKYNHWL